jgi:hypothetical protein
VEQRVLLPEAMSKPGLCQVRINTQSPCPRRAEVEILGVAFCGPCARKQEAYSTIGELTHEDERELHSKTLAEVLERKRQRHTGSKESIAAQMHHGPSGACEPQAIALTNS